MPAMVFYDVQNFLQRFPTKHSNSSHIRKSYNHSHTCACAAFTMRLLFGSSIYFVQELLIVKLLFEAGYCSREVYVRRNTVCVVMLSNIVHKT